MLDKDLQKHRKMLKAAINRVLAESPEINEAIQRIREGGYDAFLIIEATVGFNKRSESGTLPGDKSDLQLTRQDERFLRSLKISPR